MSTPANLLQLQRGTKRFGIRALFESAQFSINEGEHVGVIGPNGAGKTTLFKILVGQEFLDEGEVIKSNRLRIGYLEQEAHEPVDKSAEEFLAESCSKPLWEIKALGKDLGLTDSHFAQPFHELSGGYRMRMKLLSLVGKEPNLMLLDEPTNFLDLESVLALEKFLQNYDGAFLLISHDREFLRRTTDHTLEVELGEITKFPGHIDDYFEQKAQLREILEAQAAHQDAKRKKVEDFVARFGAKATKAKQAQSRLKQLDKMEKVEIKDLPVRARIRIPPPHHTGKESLRLENAVLGYEGVPILKDVTIRLERGVHLGVVGYNGAGKSTLLKTLGGRLPLISGKRELGYQVSLSYFAQHVAEDLDPADTVRRALESKAHSDVTSQEILSLAGSLLFSGDAVDKPIRVLSGGEKSRVALGQILLKRSPLLLLDEPTNHLDFDTVEAMTEALRDYPGTVVVVSHDRSFIGRIATKILEIRDGRADIYPGTYDDYLWSLEKGALKELRSNPPSATLSPLIESRPHLSSESTNRSNSSAKPGKDLSKRYFAESKELQRKIAKHEAQLEKLLAEQNRLNLLLSSLDASDSGKALLLQETSTALANTFDSISKVENELLEMMESLTIAEEYLSRNQ
ncbi:MAG: ABC-F family ATP-binding cassette domain-containing protein [Deltaproteobacteria bacterium]|jgi:ATP-binding cassette subfamily F protein 3|nr:ABC-F family ATP-binding cassette domain-containing protein [Deltaproteobacteria bacterium]